MLSVPQVPLLRSRREASLAVIAVAVSAGLLPIKRRQGLDLTTFAAALHPSWIYRTCDIPALVHKKGTNGLFPTFLYVRFHKILGVLLKDFVNFVQKVVEFALEFLAAFSGRGELFGLFDSFFGCRALPALLFGHGAALRTPG
jgi:hypothetical protein